ncbi:MAG: flagellar hook-basal body complex protein FliE [Bacillota bacterium]|jgi:flagellar hook-basal body complex protein FliE|nr:flagellar hook-basal body complex protein FliE [Candidatus Fermentithermobacillaceae bacterium]
MYLRAASIPGVGPLVERTVARPSESTASETLFSSVLEKAAANLTALDREMSQAQIDLVTGNARDMHTAVLSAEKASLALDLVISVRNKALEAYQEIMRMPI